MSQVVKKEANEVAVYEGFEQFQGEGFSEVKTEDLAIPFLRVLADVSPQVKKRDGAYVEGAEAGMIFNTVLNEVYEAEKDGIFVIPCHYNRRYVEWRGREEGGGYVGSYTPDDPIVKTVTRSDQGQDLLPNGNQLTNTAQFFVLMLHPELGPQKALMTMASTQLKKGRKWLTQAQSLTAQGKNGLYTLPLMSQVYKVTSVPEQNDKGSWYGWEIARERSLDLSNQGDKDVFDMAVAFAKSVKAGDVELNDGSNHVGTDSDDNVPF
tara:strand:- start:595 stop:1389 length:795 start_codon:yes stop_codon:yes gene_type:complete